MYGYCAAADDMKEPRTRTRGIIVNMLGKFRLAGSKSEEDGSCLKSHDKMFPAFYTGLPRAGASGSLRV